MKKIQGTKLKLSIKYKPKNTPITSGIAISSDSSLADRIRSKYEIYRREGRYPDFIFQSHSLSWQGFSFQPRASVFKIAPVSHINLSFQFFYSQSTPVVNSSRQNMQFAYSENILQSEQRKLFFIPYWKTLAGTKTKETKEQSYLFSKDIKKILHTAAIQSMLFSLQKSQDLSYQHYLIPEAQEKQNTFSVLKETPFSWQYFKNLLFSRTLFAGRNLFLPNAIVQKYFEKKNTKFRYADFKVLPLSQPILDLHQLSWFSSSFIDKKASFSFLEYFFRILSLTQYEKKSTSFWNRIHNQQKENKLQIFLSPSVHHTLYEKSNLLLNNMPKQKNISLFDKASLPDLPEKNANQYLERVQRTLTPLSLLFFTQRTSSANTSVPLIKNFQRLLFSLDIWGHVWKKNLRPTFSGYSYQDIRNTGLAGKAYNIMDASSHLHFFSHNLSDRSFLFWQRNFSQIQRNFFSQNTLFQRIGKESRQSFSNYALPSYALRMTNLVSVVQPELFHRKNIRFSSLNSLILFSDASVRKSISKSFFSSYEWFNPASINLNINTKPFWFYRNNNPGHEYSASLSQTIRNRTRIQIRPTAMGSSPWLFYFSSLQLKLPATASLYSLVLPEFFPLKSKSILQPAIFLSLPAHLKDGKSLPGVEKKFRQTSFFYLLKAYSLKGKSVFSEASLLNFIENLSILPHQMLTKYSFQNTLSFSQMLFKNALSLKHLIFLQDNTIKKQKNAFKNNILDKVLEKRISQSFLPYLSLLYNPETLENSEYHSITRPVLFSKRQNLFLPPAMRLFFGKNIAIADSSFFIQKSQTRPLSFFGNNFLINAKGKILNLSFLYSFLQNQSQKVAKTFSVDTHQLFWGREHSSLWPKLNVLFGESIATKINPLLFAKTLLQKLSILPGNLLSPGKEKNFSQIFGGYLSQAYILEKERIDFTYLQHFMEGLKTSLLPLDFRFHLLQHTSDTSHSVFMQKSFPLNQALSDYLHRLEISEKISIPKLFKLNLSHERNRNFLQSTLALSLQRMHTNNFLVFPDNKISYMLEKSMRHAFSGYFTNKIDFMIPDRESSLSWKNIFFEILKYYKKYIYKKSKVLDLEQVSSKESGSLILALLNLYKTSLPGTHSPEPSLLWPIFSNINKSMLAYKSSILPNILHHFSYSRNSILFQKHDLLALTKDKIKILQPGLPLSVVNHSFLDKNFTMLLKTTLSNIKNIFPITKNALHNQQNLLYTIGNFRLFLSLDDLKKIKIQKNMEISKKYNFSISPILLNKKWIHLEYLSYKLMQDHQDRKQKEMPRKQHSIADLSFYQPGKIIQNYTSKPGLIFQKGTPSMSKMMEAASVELEKKFQKAQNYIIHEVVPATSTQVNQIASKVYQMFEKKIAIEKDRRGIS